MPLAFGHKYTSCPRWWYTSCCRSQVRLLPYATGKPFATGSQYLLPYVVSTSCVRLCVCPLPKSVHVITSAICSDCLAYHRHMNMTTYMQNQWTVTAFLLIAHPHCIIHISTVHQAYALLITQSTCLKPIHIVHHTTNYVIQINCVSYIHITYHMNTPYITCTHCVSHIQITCYQSTSYTAVLN